MATVTTTEENGMANVVHFYYCRDAILKLGAALGGPKLSWTGSIYAKAGGR